MAENIQNTRPADEGWTTIIRPRTGWFDINLKELWQYRDLTVMFVKRNFTVLYKQTILGPAWILLNPLITTLIFNVVFGKVYFPRLTMPVSQVLTSLINFLIQAVMYLAFWLFFFATGAEVRFTPWLIAVPLVMLQVMLLSLGVGIIVSSLTTKYRDLAIAVGFGVQLWMYASPVVYPLSMLGESPRLKVLVELNPMTAPIEVFRAATLGTGSVGAGSILYSLVFTAAALVLGVVLFSRIEKTFMDTV